MDFKNKKTALVLEGGALRSLFTSGVLDFFLDKQLYFPTVCGVSAGSMCAISYLSKQRGRNAKINIDYVNDERYLGVKSLIKDKMIFNFDFLFGEISHELVPLDYKTFEESPQRLVAFATDCETGESAALDRDSCSDLLLACRASGSMPVLSKIVELDGRKYLDGGISDPLPINYIFENGFEKAVVVLTRDLTYRKKPLSGIIKRVYEKRFASYPRLLSKLYAIPEHYNQLVEQIESLERSKKIFVIRPDKPVSVKRTEKDTKKLKKLYEHGIEQARLRYEDMLIYLNS